MLPDALPVHVDADGEEDVLELEDLEDVQLNPTGAELDEVLDVGGKTGGLEL